MTISPTLGLEKAARHLWDVVIIGAGPAGAFAARELARRRLAVLLIDKASFPRWKVCGSCLNSRAVSLLALAGLDNLLLDLGAVPLNTISLAARGNAVQIPINGSMILSREAFDAGLVKAAIHAGAEFLPKAFAVTGVHGTGRRNLVVHRENRLTEISATVLLAADGLGAHILASEPGYSVRVEPGSWFGAGAIAPQSRTFYGPKTIFMACGNGGYVGLVRLEDGRLDIAGAFDKSMLKKSRKIGFAANQILAEAGFPQITHLPHMAWRGTLPLTRQLRNLAFERAFIIGDAAGYVEPFTGEGIGWALTSANAVVPLVMSAVRLWQPSLIDKWNGIHKRTVTTRQRTCRMLARGLRWPRFVGTLVQVLKYLPGISWPVLHDLNYTATI